MTKLKNKEKIFDIKREAILMYEDIKEELLYRDSKISVVDFEIKSSSSVEDSFSLKSEWVFQLSVDWSNFFIKRYNKGIFGLLLENYFNDESDDFNNEDGNIDGSELDSVLSIVNEKIVSEKLMIDFLSKRSLSTICEVYKRNKYEVSKIDSVFTVFKSDDKSETYCPYFIFSIIVKRIS